MKDRTQDRIRLMGLDKSRHSDILPSPQPDKIDYSDGVPVARDVETGELVRIQFDGETRILKAAGTGGGKTVMGKAEISRLYDMGYNILHASDSKNDMKTIDNKPGASKELMQKTEGLARGEDRHPVPVEMFAPKFLYDKYTEKEMDRSSPPSYLTPFTLPFSMVSDDDLKYLLNPSTDTQEELVQQLVDAVDDWDGLRFSVLWDLVEELDSDPVKRKLSNLENADVVGGRTTRNPLDSLGEAVVAVSVMYMDDLGEEFGKRLLYFMIAAILREWGERGLAGDLSHPSLLFLDECQEIIPADGDSQVKPVLQKLMDQWGRQMGMSVVLGTQEPSKMPNVDSSGSFNFLSKCNHLFLGPDLDEEDWKKALKSATNMYNPNRLQAWRRKFNDMMRYDHPFLYVDTERHFSVADTQVVRSLSPLVSHPG